ncbi:MAG: hypothetical protein KGZ32_01190 [Dethiobacter sp.]|jgi:hypothetical protein|nr:hypothetical protein [Dethiobacter sp.]
MSDSTKRILEMLAANKLTSDEAYRLLTALKNAEETASESDGESAAPKKLPKYLRVTVTPGENAPSDKQDRVNVRVPISLIRTGIKLTSLIPPQAFDHIDDVLKDKGIQFDVRNIKKEDLDDLIDALSDMEIDVESGNGEKVKVFVE